MGLQILSYIMLLHVGKTGITFKTLNSKGKYIPCISYAEPNFEEPIICMGLQNEWNKVKSADEKWRRG